MVNLGLSIDVTSEIILHICAENSLDKEQICFLLAELQANQRSSMLPFERKENRKYNFKKRERERGRWGELLPIAMCLPYLELDESAVLL